MLKRARYAWKLGVAWLARINLTPGCAGFVGLAPWVIRSILFLSVHDYKLFGTNIQDCLGFQPWCSSSGRMSMRMWQFFWQDEDVNVSKFICECMDVMLGADSDNQSQTSDQP